MSGLIEIVQGLCFRLPTLGDAEATATLGSVRGRGEFGPRLQTWLEESRDAFPEPVRVEYVEGISDRGVDVYLEGLRSQTAVGFQIKSENDVRQSDFLQKLKAQVTEARSYAKLQLYVIVLACPPGDNNRWMRTQRLVDEEVQSWGVGKPSVVTLTPGRAAALWQKCATPLTRGEREVLLQSRDWNSFFSDAGAPTREGEFLGRWPMPPHERFLPPNIFDKIVRSTRENPLAILAGPATVGKTFTAVQLLYQHYQSGKPVQWIEPLGIGSADFIVPASGPTMGLSERTRQMAQRLGMRPPSLPMSRYEFVAARLQPDALVLIEDPFGITDADYDYSLHTYDFFDLDECVSAITLAIAEGNHLAGCRLILTTRHGLMERWQAERRARRIGVPVGARIMHLAPENYGRGEARLSEFSTALVRACGVAKVETPESVGEAIGSRVETPQEAQLVVAELSAASTLSDVKAVLERTPVGAVERIRSYCKASTDAERLFLFLLLTTGEGEEYGSFARTYGVLHQAMGLPGDASEDESAARIRYWPLFYQVNYNDSNTVFVGGMPLYSGIHLKTAHPTVVEATRQEVGPKGEGFSDRLATTLPPLKSRSNTGSLQKAIARHLLLECRRLNTDALALLSESLRHLIEPTAIHDRRSLLGISMRLWKFLPEPLRVAFRETVKTGKPRLVVSVCGLLPFAPLPPDDAWPFYELLMKQSPHRGVTLIDNPWYYFVELLEQAPQTLLDEFDRLAAENPAEFAYVLGGFSGRQWEKFRPTWREAILSERVVDKDWCKGWELRFDSETAALNQVFSGWFLNGADCPAPLLERLRRSLRDANPKVRQLAGTYVLVYEEHLPRGFHDDLRALFQNEMDAKVVHRILQQGGSSEARALYREVASVAVERSNDVMAAWLLKALSGRGERDAEMQSLVEACVRKGGDYARAVRLSDVDLDALDSEADVVKLAYVWKQASKLPPPHLVGTPQPPIDLSDQECARIAQLIDSMGGYARQQAYVLLGHEEEVFPEPLKEFIRATERKNEPLTLRALETGRERRAKHDTRGIGFPLSAFGAKLKKKRRRSGS